VTEPADHPSKRTRSLTGFYVALGVVIALGLFGGWFWRTWNVWWFDADEAKRQQAEAAAKLGVPVEKFVDLGDGVRLELVLVPGGRFKMGSPKDEQDRNEDELQHWVVITKPFYCGKYEVTQEQWEKVMKRNPSSSKGAKNPVENVSWNDCQEFLKRLNGLSKENGPFRLPTEAEWEWACRAGTRTRFCSGDIDASLMDYAWFDANSGRTTHPVGTKKPNAWGLHDVHGNVWERCGDWYHDDYYAESPRYDPTGPTTGLIRVLRGGSSCRGPTYCRSSRRDSLYPETWTGVIGFRVVVVPAGH
jgi:formylglycine-generating enzyme required for sulfatase activity